MAPANFKSSFIPSIPKESATEKPFKKKGTGIFGVLAITLFIISILGAVGSFVYKNILNSSIDNMKAELSATEQAIDKETIHQLSIFSDKLSVTRSIINKHAVISNVMSILEEETVSSVYFTDFSYDSMSLEGFTLNLTGHAGSYAALALQDNILRQNSNFKSVEVSGLSLTQGGLVSFKFMIIVDPKTLVYEPEEGVVSTETEVSDLEELNKLEEEISNLE